MNVPRSALNQYLANAGRDGQHADVSAGPNTAGTVHRHARYIPPPFPPFKCILPHCGTACLQAHFWTLRYSECIQLYMLQGVTPNACKDVMGKSCTKLWWLMGLAIQPRHVCHVSAFLHSRISREWKVAPPPPSYPARICIASLQGAPRSHTMRIRCRYLGGSDRQPVVGPQPLHERPCGPEFACHPAFCIRGVLPSRR